MRFVAFCSLVLLLAPGSFAEAADGNRLTYLDESDPFYVSRRFPKLTTPQWVGDEGVQAVVILAIDDMKEPGPWETYLRPILERLKQIDGRSPVSIMTNRIDLRHPQLQAWLKEGLSLEVHTYDHPCPLLQGGDLAKARATYERCVDQMDAIPGSRAVAFRMPCCDSMNSPSPRFFAEIFNRRTSAGNFLSIDSSVSNVITANDPELPRELVLDEQSREIFRKYLPFKSFQTKIEDYPYPYIIGRLCWEFPCVMPSDWSAQKLLKPKNPQVVADWKKALDAAVIKQGVFTLIFHPYKWIDNTQIIELVDYAVATHGKKVKFLNFREAQQRINKNLLAGQSLRREDGGDNGLRLVDLNNDGYLDVVIGNETLRQTRLWSPEAGKWIIGDFPLVLGEPDSSRADTGARFGILHADCYPSVITRNERTGGAWHFDGKKWNADATLTAGLALARQPIATARSGRDLGVRLRDVDDDGTCELIVANPTQRAVFGFDTARGWAAHPFSLPKGVTLVDAEGRDAGLRFVDIDLDGRDDILVSNETGFGAYLFTSSNEGWSQMLVAGKPGDAGAIPMIARAATNNGAWIKDRRLWVQNEDTDKLPDVVDRKPLDDLLKDILFPGSKSPEQSLAVTYARRDFRSSSWRPNRW